MIWSIKNFRSGRGPTKLMSPQNNIRSMTLFYIWYVRPEGTSERLLYHPRYNWLSGGLYYPSTVFQQELKLLISYYGRLHFIIDNNNCNRKKTGTRWTLISSFLNAYTVFFLSLITIKDSSLRIAEKTCPTCPVFRYFYFIHFITFKLMSLISLRAYHHKITSLIVIRLLILWV